MSRSPKACASGRARSRPTRALLTAAAVSMLLSPSAFAQGLHCPSEAELADLERSVGTGGDNQRKVYLYFGERFGRPASLDQHGNSAEIGYGAGRGTLKVSLDRNPATGNVTIRCRDGR